jgi:hypothetical protein
MTQTRTHLTLFTNKKDTKIIEEIRQKFNQKKYALTQSHVTLFR